MEIRYRKVDVEKIRTEICQDLLKLIIKDNWQEELFRKCETEINGQHKAIYIETYDKMCEYENLNDFSIEMMDVTIINAIIQHYDELLKFKIRKDTRIMLGFINDTRKKDSHSNKNETTGELHVQCLFCLYNLEKLLKIINDKEDQIDIKDRQLLVRKYSVRIKELKNLIDEEYIKLVYIHKKIDDDIQKMIESSNPEEKWLSFFTGFVHQDRAFRDYNEFNEYAIKASEAGIKNTHLLASRVLLIGNDYEEFNRHFNMFIESKEPLSGYDIKNAVEQINIFVEKGNKITQEMTIFLSRVEKEAKGFELEKTEEGLYNLKCISDSISKGKNRINNA